MARSLRTSKVRWKHMMSPTHTHTHTHTHAHTHELRWQHWPRVCSPLVTPLSASAADTLSSIDLLIWGLTRRVRFDKRIQSCSAGPAHAPISHTRCGMCAHSELVSYWRNEYKVAKNVASFNRMPQFTTSIAGRRLHFVHRRCANPSATPILLAHGWPGSVHEFHKIVEPLARDFHVVICTEYACE